MEHDNAEHADDVIEQTLIFDLASAGTVYRPKGRPPNRRRQKILNSPFANYNLRRRLYLGGSRNQSASSAVERRSLASWAPRSSVWDANERPYKLASKFAGKLIADMCRTGSKVFG